MGGGGGWCGDYLGGLVGGGARGWEGAFLWEGEG